MTNNELLGAILNRLDLIYTLLLIAFSAGGCILVVYLLYKVLVRFF